MRILTPSARKVMRPENREPLVPYLEPEVPEQKPPLGNEYSLESAVPITSDVPRASTGSLASPETVGRSWQEPKRGRVGDFTALMGCNAIVFVTSVCLMVLELTASRLIAGYVGSSLYTWTSVIGVVLAGISFGNYFGGWLADRYPPRKLLGWQFLAASLLTLSVLFLNNIAATTDRPAALHWQWWVMLVVAFVFLSPAIALGTISPVVASMALKRSSRTGMTVGNIYAWGAMGSIVGTFLAGFWLIGELGTKQIIWMTATVLLLMGAIVAGASRTLRMVMLFGLLQWVLLVGVCSSTTADQGGNVLRTLAGVRSLWRTGPEHFAREAAALQEAENARNESEIDRLKRSHEWRESCRTMEEAWENWGRQLGAQLHGLGIICGLRGDFADRYFDESDYYAISIYDGLSDGDTVRQLRLDYLLHSYYNPVNPTKLYYDYERVYAALTERAANGWKRQTEVPLESVPDEAVMAGMPAGVAYSATDRKLSVQGGMSLPQLRHLLGSGPYAPFREAVLRMWEAGDRDWTKASRAGGGALYVPLPELPPGVVVSSDLSSRLRYDRPLRSLVCTAPISLEEALDLISQGDEATYASAVTDLFRRSRQTSTLFIGGGGFVFPRWIESRFPHEPLIDVAEIDPAVKAAVEAEMGLPDEFGPARDGKTRVQTRLGDARKFVDEQLRENGQLVAKGNRPVTYDFVYGDAFNDLSVPWHLTTREFSEKIRNLLTPGEGIYMVNIIDIYPRAQYPTPADKVESPDGSSERRMLTRPLPAGLRPAKANPWTWEPVTGELAQLEVYQAGDEGYFLGFRGIMNDATRDRILALVGNDEELAKGIRDLQQQTRGERVGQFLGRYVNTAVELFDYVYLFTSNESEPGDARDTFVVACSLKPLDMTELAAAGGHWKSGPFAWTAPGADGRPAPQGAMPAILELARGQILTDNFAPVDNLLAPVFVSRSADTD